jgi:hypothetical protein
MPASVWQLGWLIERLSLLMLNRKSLEKTSVVWRINIFHRHSNLFFLLNIFPGKEPYHGSFFQINTRLKTPEYFALPV